MPMSSFTVGLLVSARGCGAPEAYATGEVASTARRDGCGSLRAEARRGTLVAKRLQQLDMAVDDSQHFEDVRTEPIAAAQRKHVKSGREMAGDTREGTDLMSARAGVEHSPAW